MFLLDFIFKGKKFWRCLSDIFRMVDVVVIFVFDGDWIFFFNNNDVLEK